MHAVCLLAEVGAVEVSGEDRRLAVAILELDRDGGVFELAPRVVIVPVKVEDLGELLGDRARPLGQRKVRDVVGQRAEHADDVDSVMAVEPFVLGRNHRVLQDQRHLAELYRPSARAAQARLDPMAKCGRSWAYKPRGPAQSRTRGHHCCQGSAGPPPTRCQQTAHPHRLGAWGPTASVAAERAGPRLRIGPSQHSTMRGCLLPRHGSAHHPLTPSRKSSVVNAARELALAEARRILQPSGRLVICDMMFSLSPEPRDRRVIAEKVVALMKRGPAGVVRIPRNAARVSVR